MKTKKFKKLVKEIEQFMAEYYSKHCFGVLFKQDIIEEFDHYKKKHVKRAYKKFR